jgi:hypothetical protein
MYIFYAQQDLSIHVLAWISYTAEVTCIVLRGTNIYHRSEPWILVSSAFFFCLDETGDLM